MKALCPQCGNEFDAVTGRFNRAKKICAPLYCGRICAGVSHRSKVQPTESEKRAAKAEYDREYRAKNLDLIKGKKRAYFKSTYNPAAAAIIRKQRMPNHVEYCRRPAYRAKKSIYDRRHRAVKVYGEYAESFLTLLTIEETIDSRATSYERRMANGTINKAQTRRRAL